VITLKDGDELVGAVELGSPDCDLIFIADDAQLLRFGAAKVRPQGRPAGGMAGINLAEGAKVIFFGAIDLSVPDGEWASSVVTITGLSAALPGAEQGSVKQTPFAEFPVKGRATGGVRCHRFLKGEVRLAKAWAGLTPVLAHDPAGAPVLLPPANGRRDGSGTPMAGQVRALGGAVATTEPTPVTGDADGEEIDSTES
jgi:DNA gyrase subunit A